MITFSLRAILLTTALVVAAPAWAQDQSKPDAAKSDAPVKTADATPAKAVDDAPVVSVASTQRAARTFE